MDDPKEQERIEPTFGSKSVQEESLERIIENYQTSIKFNQTLIEGLEKRIVEKDSLITLLYSEMDDLKTEVNNLKLRLIGTGDRPHVFSQATTMEEVRRIISTEEQAKIFYHLMENGPISYAEIAKRAALTKQHVNSYLNGDAKPLIQKPRRGLYAATDDLKVRKFITEVLSELLK